MQSEAEANLAGAIKPLLKSQYHAGLAMLRDAVAQCPESLWAAPGHVSAFWQVSYHVLFYTHLYLHHDEASFVPWEGHRPDAQNRDGLTRAPKPESAVPVLPPQYSQADVLRFWDVCAGMVDGAVDAMDLGAAACGFWWYQVSKLEHQLINLRHLQHHTAQLADRLRTATDRNVKWVGAVQRG